MKYKGEPNLCGSTTRKKNLFCVSFRKISDYFFNFGCNRNDWD